MRRLRSVWNKLQQRPKGTTSVLIADDEDDIRTIARSLMEEAGFQPVWEAPDGETAIEIVYKHHPDVVVLDYMMPRMDGEAVARVIRMLSPESAIVIFSGVLKVPPAWKLTSDAYLEKTEIECLPAVVSRLAALHQPGS